VPSKGDVNTSLKSVGVLGALGIVVVDDVVVDDVAVEDVVVVGKSDASSQTESDFVVPYSLPRDSEKQSGTEPVLIHSNR
jgi:hypothetical protein